MNIFFHPQSKKKKKIVYILIFLLIINFVLKAESWTFQTDRRTDIQDNRFIEKVHN